MWTIHINTIHNSEIEEVKYGSNSAYRDMVQKKKLYARFGVMEYWIVIPEEESIDIYILKDNACTLYKRYTIDEILESPSIIGLRIELKEIF